MASISELIEAAEKHIDGGVPEDAEPLVRLALARAPNAPRVLKAAGRLALARGDGAAAVSALEQAFARMPDDAATAVDLGLARAVAGDGEGARRTLERALALAPRSVKAHRALAEVLLAEEAFDEAIAHLGAARRLDPDDPSILLALGEALVRAGSRADARAALLEVLKRAPEDVAARCQLATLALAAGRPEEARAHAEKAYFADPRNPFAAALHAEALARTGAAEEALAVLALVLPAHPHVPELVEAFALASAYAGRPEAGLKPLAARLKENPSPEGFLVAARVFAMAGRLPAAAAAARKAMAEPELADLARPVLRHALFLSGAFEAFGALSQGTPTAEDAGGDAGEGAAEGAAPDVLVPSDCDAVETVALARVLAPDRPGIVFGRVIAPPALVPVLSRIAGPGRAVSLAEANAGPSVGPVLPLASLPGILPDPAAVLAFQRPYLARDRAHDDLWTEALAPLARPRVGVVWHRHPPAPALPDVLAAVRRIPGASLLSLAWDELREDLEGVEDVVDAGYHLASLEAAIDLVGHLDLVVGPDTLPVHFAGAQGVPAVALLAPDRRWIWAEAEGRAVLYPSVVPLVRDWTETWAALSDRILAAAVAALSPPPPAEEGRGAEADPLRETG